MYNMGLLYINGRNGLRQDDVEAVRWFQRSADAGNSDSLALLGHCYLFGAERTKCVA
jgi:TPR repeat protein